MNGYLLALDRPVVGILIIWQCFCVGNAARAWRSRCRFALSDDLIARISGPRKLHILAIRTAQALWRVNLLELCFTAVTRSVVLLDRVRSSFASGFVRTGLLAASCPTGRILPGLHRSASLNRIVPESH